MPERSPWDPEHDRRTLDGHAIHESREVGGWLRSLRDASVQLRLHPRAGGRAITARLRALATTPPALTLEPEDEPRPADLAAGAVAVGWLDAVKFQFDLDPLQVLHHEGRAWLRSPTPAVLHRLQRREAYRVRPLDDAPAACSVPASERGERIALPVLDVSVGGVLLQAPFRSASWRAGEVLRDCLLDLPDAPLLRCDLLLRSLRDEHRGDAVRLGCEFVDLDGPQARVVQIYVNATDKRRRQSRPA